MELKENPFYDRMNSLNNEEFYKVIEKRDEHDTIAAEAATKIALEREHIKYKL